MQTVLPNRSLFYQNSTTGVRFEYPPGWQKEPDNLRTNITSITLHTPFLRRGRSIGGSGILTISITNNSSQYLTLGDLTKAKLENAKQGADATLAGYPAYDLRGIYMKFWPQANITIDSFKIIR